MIVNCQACGSSATLPDDHGGRRFACPKCGAVLPDPPASAPTPAGDDDPLGALAAASASAPRSAPLSHGSYGPPVQGAYRAPDTAPGAVAAMVCGILSLVVPCGGLVLAIIAIVMANKAQEYLRRYPQQYTGQGMATAGKVLGIVGLVLCVLAMCIWFAAVAGSR